MNSKFSVKKVLTPALVATFLLSPMLVLEKAQAAERTGIRQNRRDNNGGAANPNRRGNGNNRGNGRTTTTPSNNTANTNLDIDFSKIPQDIRSRYTGPLSIDLTRDPDMARNLTSESRLRVKLKAATKVFNEKTAAVKKANEEKVAIDKKIADLSTAIVDAVSKKNELKESLPKKQRELKKINKELVPLKAQADLNKTALTEAETSCTAAPTPACQKKVSVLKSVVAASDKALADKEAQKVAKQKEIAETSATIAKIEKENAKRNTDLKLERQKQAAAKAKLQVAKNELAPVKKSFDETKASHNVAVKTLKQYKERLLARIIRLNKLGADFGHQEGADDGIYLSKRMGINLGAADGDRDGTREGIEIGKRLAREAGRTQGEIEGRAAGEDRGQRVGTAEGSRQGNIDAGNREGRQAGIAEANNSDAASVGTGQGRTAGFNRAVRVGNTEGTRKGEAQGINQFESSSLNSTQASGDFAGAFAAQIPGYPGFNCVEFNGRRYRDDDYGWRGQRNYAVDREMCPSFKPRHDQLRGHKLQILQKAFRDGYIFTYRKARRRNFQNNIDNTYLNSYDSAREAAIDYNNNPELYPNERSIARNNAFTATEATTFGIVRQRVFDRVRADFSSNPERGSSEYTSEFSRSKRAAYASRYEDIRQDSYSKEEVATFDANIKEQTEIYRAKRLEAVSNIYKNNAVLKYVGSSISDGGINGIAKADGVFQPGEKTLHTVTITNFGLKPANNVKVTMDNGQSFKLPSIAGKSTVTIKGASKGQISQRASIGGRFNSILRVYSPVTAESAIQGRHFANAAQGLLNSGDSKIVPVKYPLSITSLSSKSQLLKGQANGLKMDISNNSNRKYTGPLKIELNVNSRGNIITKGFNDLSGLSGSTTLNDAQLLANDMEDVYRPLSFSAVVKKQGVTLGVLTRNYHTMVKAAYVAKSGNPVVLVNSNIQAEQLLDLVSDMGGLQNISVLDLSLPTLNANALAKGLDNKVVIAMNDQRSSNMPKLDQVLKTTSNAAIIIADDNATGRRGLDNLLKLSSMKDALIFKSKFAGYKERSVAFNNMYRGKTEGQNSILQGTMSNYKALLSLAGELALTGDQAIAKIKSSINKNNFFSPQLSIQALNLKAFSEVKNIKTAHKEDGKQSKYEKYAKSSDRLYRKLFAASNTRLNDSNVGLALSSVALNEMLKDDFASCFLSNKITCAVHKERKGVVKSIDKKLKKFDKRLRSNANSKAEIQDPRVKEQSANDNDWEF